MDEQLNPSEPLLRALDICLGANHGIEWLSWRSQRDSQLRIQHSGELDPHFWKQLRASAHIWPCFRTKQPHTVLSRTRRSSFYQNSGFATYLYNHQPFGGLQVPSASVANYLGAENYIGWLHYSNIWEYRGDYAKTIGRHSIRTGASLATDGWEQPFFGSENDFDLSQTQDGNLDSNTGDRWRRWCSAYRLLRSGQRVFAAAWRQDHRSLFPGSVACERKADCKPGSALRRHRQSASRQGLQRRAISPAISTSPTAHTFCRNPAPACSPTQGAPCIPGGVLPPDVTIAKNGKIIHDNYDNIQPRFGFAYRLTTKTVMHGGYGQVLRQLGRRDGESVELHSDLAKYCVCGCAWRLQSLSVRRPGWRQDPFDFGNVSAKRIPASAFAVLAL